MEDKRNIVSICPKCVKERFEKMQDGDIEKKLDGANFVKKCFVDGDKKEHMWVKIYDIDFDDKLVNGFLDSEPVLVKNVKLDDRVTVKFDEVEDILT
jgi:uncharacterized protein YegJ (DUF2314 family)